MDRRQLGYETYAMGELPQATPEDRLYIPAEEFARIVCDQATYVQNLSQDAPIWMQPVPSEKLFDLDHPVFLAPPKLNGVMAPADENARLGKRASVERAEVAFLYELKPEALQMARAFRKRVQMWNASHEVKALLPPAHPGEWHPLVVPEFWFQDRTWLPSLRVYHDLDFGNGLRDLWSREVRDAMASENLELPFTGSKEEWRDFLLSAFVWRNIVVLYQHGPDRLVDCTVFEGNKEMAPVASMAFFPGLHTSTLLRAVLTDNWADIPHVTGHGCGHNAIAALARFVGQPVPDLIDKWCYNLDKECASTEMHTGTAYDWAVITMWLSAFLGKWLPALYIAYAILMPVSWFMGMSTAHHGGRDALHVGATQNLDLLPWGSAMLSAVIMVIAPVAALGASKAAWELFTSILRGK